MTFVDATAISLGVPYPIVQRATRKLLVLLREHAPESDMQILIAALPDLTELDAGAVRHGQFTRLLQGVRRLTAGARTTRLRLQRTGLGNDDVAFASAFATHLRQHLGESLTTRLVASVPGLTAMSSWPLKPYIIDQKRADQASAHQAIADRATANQAPVGQPKQGHDGPSTGRESAHHARPEPPTMS